VTAVTLPPGWRIGKGPEGYALYDDKGSTVAHSASRALLLDYAADALHPDDEDLEAAS
jgi:hypothetical protein